MFSRSNLSIFIPCMLTICFFAVCTSLFLFQRYMIWYMKCQNISIQTFINMLEDSDDFFVLLRKISTHKLEAQEL
jgi:hypothetical protein